MFFLISAPYYVLGSGEVVTNSDPLEGVPTLEDALSSEVDSVQANTEVLSNNTVVNGAEATEEQTETLPDAPNWKECHGAHNSDFLKVKNCANAKDNSYQVSSSKYAGSYSSHVCQAVFQIASLNGSDWKTISKDLYKSGSSHNLDYVRAIAVFKKDGEDDFLTISNAIDELMSCVQVATAFGQNFEMERDEKDAYITPEKLTSLNGRITCKLSGLETLDYDECSDLITAQNVAILGKTAHDTYQQYDAMDFTSEQQLNMMNLDATANITTEALKAQKEGLKKQEEMAEERKVARIAHATAVLGASRLIPSSEDYFENDELCKRPIQQALVNISSISTTVQYGSTFSALDICKRNFSKFSFLRNGEARQAGYLIASEAGIDATKEHLIAETLDEQQDMIGNAIGKIEDMETITIPEEFYTNQDVYMAFCDANPTHSECRMNTSSTVNVPSFGDYNVGGLGTNQAYKESKQEERSLASVSETSDPKVAGVDTSKVFNPTKAGSGGLGHVNANAPAVSEGGAIAQGSGGGGSSPGGGGGGGSSSSPQGQDGAKGGKTIAGIGAGTNSKYLGGRGPSFVGGRGGSTAKKKNPNENPFGSLFRKDKKRTIGSLNYDQEKIGTKEMNIFHRISKAYDEVDNKGNLIKYELK
ncbi:hypothetical protein [Halobacteriovorax sp. CON-3]|uniref:hypothetical protein n=1 Tax=Halobacteriovorax sp. CON-3 TaxID=3157710 RepID=UPI0037238094